MLGHRTETGVTGPASAFRDNLEAAGKRRKRKRWKCDFANLTLSP